MIAGPGERRCRHHQKTFAIGGPFIGGKFLWCDETVNPVMFGRRLQVLSDRQKIHVGGAHVVHDLPDGHPLWSLPNVIITPHTGNTKAMARPLLGGRITGKVRRYAAGRPLGGPGDGEPGH